MSVNILNDYLNQTTPYFVTPIETAPLQFSTLQMTGWLSSPQVVVSQASISSINGVTYPNTLFTSPTNGGTLSGATIGPGTWTSLVSTPTSYNWLAGKVYDVSFPIGINMTATPVDANTNVSLGVGIQGVTTPATARTTNVLSNSSQVQLGGILSATLTPASNVTAPLVSYMFLQNNSSNATVSCGGAGSSNSLYKILQLN